MTDPPRTGWATLAADEERYRPLYARVLGLRFVNPGGVLCFLYFEGVIALAALLALAELVSWWAVLVLPATVALMVKLNDMVAASVVRSAALVPEQERDRFRRQLEPAVGRATVPSRTATGELPGRPGHPGGTRRSSLPPRTDRSPAPAPARNDRRHSDRGRPGPGGQDPVAGYRPSGPAHR
ncbi:hypothetical protein [Micromonospora cathayae]|uniref:Sensor domain-containing protein n=1 Tax=Micromonospora cathayae TaxID=3028804 RepID=A0ABY7ZPW2_9ACTN|nr:hypothetical protein [Micromonospora sp. HUAS 3]WDZ84811.1 hypothetical protein PVK37_31075 [Micromonospora sp. HUAS 3]